MDVERIGNKQISIDEHLWHECKTRQSQACSDCGKYCEKGTTMYRPSGRVYFKSERLCLDCVAKLLKPVALDTNIEEL